jgi:glycosyltransferase involved in cell wall biosynthesis
LSKNLTRVSIIIPTLNEEIGIREVLQNIPFRELGETQILVVDGGSIDGTVELAKSLGATVLPQSEKGYGNAISEGMRYANGDYIVVIDGDGVYDAKQIPRLLKIMDSQKADLVIGSRYLGVIEPGSIPIFRHIINRLLTLTTNWLLGVNFTDITSGFRVFRKDLVYKIRNEVTEPAQYSTIYSTYRRHGKIIEVPITFYPRLGRSKMFTISNGFQILRRILGSLYWGG